MTLTYLAKAEDFFWGQNISDDSSDLARQSLMAFGLTEDQMNAPVGSLTLVPTSLLMDLRDNQDDAQYFDDAATRMVRWFNLQVPLQTHEILEALEAGPSHPNHRRAVEASLAALQAQRKENGR